MPEASALKIEERDGKYCAVSADGSRSFGCFPTEQAARERLRQVEAAKAAKMSLDELEVRECAILKDVEIFRTGTWNGDKYSEADLDEMVNAFPKAGFKPPVKLGHDEKSGDPAFGFVTALKRVGDRLVAELSDIPDKLADAIRNRRFDAVSSEIFFNLTRDNEKFRRALKAVALLGAEIPAVSDLKPLRDSAMFGDGAGEVHVYSLSKGDIDMSEDKTQIAELEAKIAKLTEENASLKQKGDDGEALLQVKSLQEQVAELSKVAAQAQEDRRRERIDNKVKDVPFPALHAHFSALYDMASRDGAKTATFKLDDEKQAEISGEKVIDDLVKRLSKIGAKLFNEHSEAGDLRRPDTPPAKNSTQAGAELVEIANKYMAEKGEKNFQMAFDTICADPENRELVRVYAGTTH